MAHDAVPSEVMGASELRHVSGRTAGGFGSSGFGYPRGVNDTHRVFVRSDLSPSSGVPVL